MAPTFDETNFATEGAAAGLASGLRVAGNEIERPLAADRFLVEIAASSMARYRVDELTSGDISLLIVLLGKIGFSPSERGKSDLPYQKI